MLFLIALLLISSLINHKNYFYFKLDLIDSMRRLVIYKDYRDKINNENQFTDVFY
jgi:hypothetical protein